MRCCKKDEEDEVRREKRPRSEVTEEDDDVAAEEKEDDDVAEKEKEDDDVAEEEGMMDDVILGDYAPTGWSRPSYYEPIVKPMGLYDAVENESKKRDRNASNAYGKDVPNNMMSEAELWKSNLGVRWLAPGEDAFKEGIGALPGTLVNVQKPGEDSYVGVVREVLPDNSYKIARGSDGNGDILTALPNEINVVPPMESDKVKILGGIRRGDTGNLIRINGNKGFVQFDHPFRVLCRMNMKMVAKLVHV